MENSYYIEYLINEYFNNNITFDELDETINALDNNNNINILELIQQREYNLKQEQNNPEQQEHQEQHQEQHQEPILHTNNLIMENSYYIEYLINEYFNNNITFDELDETINALDNNNNINILELIQQREYNLKQEQNNPEQQEHQEQHQEQNQEQHQEPILHTKNIRYRDNKIVTTKGEKFIIEKPVLTDKLKKTFINLKPGKKYRFH